MTRLHRPEPGHLTPTNTKARPMTARNLAQAQPASLAALVSIEARFDLELLKGSDDNPLPSGGLLVISGIGETVENLDPGTTVHATALVSATLKCGPMVSMVLESGGHRLLRLDLEVTKVGKDAEDRVEVLVTSRGILPEHATCLGIATDTCAWRLSGEATRNDERLRLTFGLAQELVAPMAPVTALASVRLPFAAGEGDEPKHARIKIKPSGTGLQVPTA